MARRRDRRRRRLARRRAGRAHVQGDPDRPHDRLPRLPLPAATVGGLGRHLDLLRRDGPEIWRVPLRDQLVADLTVTAPRAGYLVAAGFAAIVAPRLGAHAIAYRRLDHPVTATVEAFYPTGVEHAPPFEGRTRATIAGQWRSERRTIEAGALWIPIRQPRARLAMHLLEPAAPDSLAAWGFFNAALEQKEYMESYVAEEVAREMLKDPAIKRAFEQSLADPTFAASPERRLDFFYRRHPSWQSQRRELPVLRADIAPPGQRSMP